LLLCAGPDSNGNRIDGSGLAGGFRSSGPELVLLGALPTDRVPGATSSIRRCSDVLINAYADRYSAIDRLRALRVSSGGRFDD